MWGDRKGCVCEQLFHDGELSRGCCIIQRARSERWLPWYEKLCDGWTFHDNQTHNRERA